MLVVMLSLLPAKWIISLLLTGGGLGGLSGGSSNILGCGGLDDTDGNGLSHVSNGETSEGSELAEGLDTHGLAGDQLDDGGVSRLDELGLSLCGLT